VFGLVDWIAIPKGTRAKRIGSDHALTNVGVLALFFVSGLVRFNQPSSAVTGGAFVLSLIAVAFGAFGAIGGELVDRLGVGVDDIANLDAPSSLGRTPPPAVNPVGADDGSLDPRRPGLTGRS
jgi:uncharacterized membrane protein